MELPPSNKRKNHHIINTVIVSILMLMTLIVVLFYYNEKVKQDNEMEITKRFMNFENSFKHFINDNAVLLTGFSAYIDTFDDYKDEEVYAYLENFMKENGDYINNLAIVKDTTIKWNYPLEGNEGTIGIDLLRVPGQADDIRYVKEKLKKGFSGPVELIQGGSGYIIRVPIMKDGSFWGVASMILRGEKLTELFDIYAKENNLIVTIYKENPDISLIYGNENNIYWKTLKFERELLGESLTYSVKPLKNTLNYGLTNIIVILVSGLVLTGLTTYKAYWYFKGHEEILRKNYILKSSAIRDKLTGIYNRDYLDISMGEEIKFANTYSTAVSIIYFDINSFKNINDTHGHTFGDNVLKETASKVKSQLRSSNIFARWGGDEFAVLMPNTTISGAESTAERIREAIESIEHPGTGNLSASIGVAEYSIVESADSWFKRVDKALYEAKANKANTICICDHEGNLKCGK